MRWLAGRDPEPHVKLYRVHLVAISGRFGFSSPGPREITQPRCDHVRDGWTSASAALAKRPVGRGIDGPGRSC